MASLFGTDGVRGEANTGNMTPGKITKLAQAVICDSLQSSNAINRFTVVIGKDTRLSGYMVESALLAGFLSMGVDAILLGPLPTPAVSMLTRSLRAQLGVMISASHNPFQDNGIKFFNSDGYKLSENTEHNITKILNCDIKLCESKKIGKAQRLEDAVGRYIEFAKATIPKGLKFEGMKIAIDCANGSAYKVAPKVLWELGAEIVVIGNTPNGANINLEYGATDLKNLQATVVNEHCDIGLAFDGDADRLIIVNHLGCILDGDQVLAILSTFEKNNGDLKGGVTGTIMSNLGLEHYLGVHNIAFTRANVGDRSVIEIMRKHNSLIGGEPSGHTILANYSTTGDGLVTALQVLKVLKLTERKQIKQVFEPVAQITKNLKLQLNLHDDGIASIIKNFERQIRPFGRLVVRQSGTEAILRIMAEGSNTSILKKLTDELAFELHNVNSSQAG